MSKSTVAILHAPGTLGAYLASLTWCVADEDSNGHFDPMQVLFLDHICKTDRTPALCGHRCHI